MKKTFAIIFSLSTFLAAGCTLTPPKGGDDLLDTGHKVEHQDPVTVPSGPYSAATPAHAIAEKKAAPATSAPAKLVADVKEEKKAEPEVKIEPKVEAKPEEKPVAKAEIKAEVKVEEKAEPVAEIKEEIKKDSVVIPNEIKTQPHSAVEFVEAKPPAKPVEPEAKAEVKEEVKKETTSSSACTEKLKAGDKINIAVTKEKDLTGSYMLDKDGVITYPLLGKVAAKDMTVAQLQEILKTRLANGYLVKPEVHVGSSSACPH